MNVVEIIFARRAPSALKLKPRPSGVTLVPIDMPGLSSADVAGAVRETLSSPRRSSATRDIPLVQIAVGDERGQTIIIDDAARQVRGIREAHGDKTFGLEADTSSLADDIRLEAIFSKIADLFGVEAFEDLAPALARSRSAPRELSPKEIALQRAHERTRVLGIEVRALDRSMNAPQIAPRTWLLGIIGTIALLIGGTIALPPALRRIVLPAISFLLIGVLIALAVRVWRRLDSRASVEASRTRKCQEREQARREMRELGETLRKKGVDPDEVLGRLAVRGPVDQAPVVVHRTAMSSAELTALGDLGRQVIVFVDRSELLFPEDYGDVLRSFEGSPARPPPVPVD